METPPTQASQQDGAYREPLRHLEVALSISDSSDLAARGLGPEHLTDALTEMARHLLALGARLVYGGDLRADGFTHVLAELVLRHRRDVDSSDRRASVRNVLAWPVVRATSADDLGALLRAVDGVAQLEWLDSAGAVHNVAEGVPDRVTELRDLTTADWHDGLTAMRRYVTKSTDARVLVGGRRTDYAGRMPGLLEEALCSLQVGQPLFVLGGFGGIAFDIAASFGLAEHDRDRARGTTGTGTTMHGFEAGQLPRDGFSELQLYSAASLRNGLSVDENKILATTPHIDHAIVLVLRGLTRLAATTT